MLLPDVLVPLTREEDMSDSLSAVSTGAYGVQDTGHFPAKEEVLESDLLGSELDKQSAFAFGKAAV